MLTMFWVTRLVLRHGSITLIVIGVDTTVLKLPSLAMIET